MNQKRRYYQNANKETTIDETYLIKTFKMVTPDELRLFVNIPYETYFIEYNKKKLKTFYSKYQSFVWFQENYLTKKTKDESIQIKYNNFLEHCNESMKENCATKADNTSTLPNTSFVLPTNLYLNYPKKNIIVKNIKSTDTKENILEFCSKCPGFKDLNIIIMFNKHVIQRYVIIALDDSTNVDESIYFLKESINNDYVYNPLVFDNIFCKITVLELQENDKKYVISLLQKFSKIYSSDDALFVIDENASFDYNVLLLRFVFNYCFYCAKKFESSIEMVNFCGDFHFRCNNEGEENNLIENINKYNIDCAKNNNFSFDKYTLKTNNLKINYEVCQKIVNLRKIFNRKNEIICMNKNFEALKPKPAEEQFFTGKHKKINNSFSCNFCEKQFETEETIKKHLHKKHNDEYEEIKNEVANYELFLENIDTKLLCNLEGLEDWTVPAFLNYTQQEVEYKNETIYDMERIFSGEIKLKH